MFVGGRRSLWDIIKAVSDAFSTSTRGESHASYLFSRNCTNFSCKRSMPKVRKKGRLLEHFRRYSTVGISRREDAPRRDAILAWHFSLAVREGGAHIERVVGHILDKFWTNVLFLSKVCPRFVQSYKMSYFCQIIFKFLD